MRAVLRYLDAFSVGAFKGAGAAVGILGAIWLLGLWPDLVALLEAATSALDRMESD